MRLGAIDSVLRPDGADDRTVFERARSLGLDGVEVDLRPGDLGSPGRLSRLREAASLAVLSLIVAVHNAEGGIADADPAVARRAAAEVRTAVEWAVALGADLVLVPFFAAGALADDAAAARCGDAFARLCPHAERGGVTLAFEGTLGADAIRTIAERAASPAFGCYFDLANALDAGFDGPAEIRRLGALVRRVHIKDTRERRGDCRPGEGRVDFAASARALADIGYDGWLVLETPPAAPEVVTRDVALARQYFPLR